MQNWVQSLGWEDALGEGKGYPLQYSGLENSTDCIAHGVAKSRTRLSDFHFLGFPGGASGKEPACQCRRYERYWFNLWFGETPRRRAWQPTPVFLPGESHGQRSPVVHSPGGHKESDRTEHTNTESGGALGDKLTQAWGSS